MPVRRIAVALICALMVQVAGAEAVTVTLYGLPPGGSESALASVVSARYPDITLQVVRATIPEMQSPSAATTRAESTTADLIVWPSAGMAGFARRGLLSSLDPLLERDAVDLGEPPSLVESLRIGGELYDLPLFASPFVVAYNAQLLQDAGAALPSGDWTWSDFRATAQLAMQTGSGPKYGATSMPFIWMLMIAATGEPLQADPAVIAQALDLVRAMALGSHLLMVDSGNGVQSSGAFNRGEAAMYVTMLTQGGLASLHRHVPELGIAPLPAWSASQHGAFAQLSTIGVTRSSRHPDAAWKVAQLLAGRPGQTALAAAGTFPARVDPQTIAALTRALSEIAPYGVESLAQLQLVIPRRTDRSVGDIFAFGTLTSALSAYLAGTTSYDETLANVRQAQLKAQAEAGAGL